MKKIFKRLLTKWYYFLIALMVISVSFSLITNSLSTPSREESVTIFIATNNVKSNLEDRLNENRPDYLERIFVNYKQESDQYIGYTFLTSGVVMSDCFILSSDFVDPSEYSSTFYQLDTTYINNYFSQEFEYITYENIAYGIKVYDKNTTNGYIKEYITYSNKDYYLFFNLDSKQLGALNNSNEGVFFLIEKIIDLS